MESLDNYETAIEKIHLASGPNFVRGTDPSESVTPDEKTGNKTQRQYV